MRFCCRKFSKLFLTFDKNSDVFFWGGAFLALPLPHSLLLEQMTKRRLPIIIITLMIDLGLRTSPPVGNQTTKHMELCGKSSYE